MQNQQKILTRIQKQKQAIDTITQIAMAQLNNNYLAIQQIAPDYTNDKNIIPHLIGDLVHSREGPTAKPIRQTSQSNPKLPCKNKNETPQNTNQLLKKQVNPRAQKENLLLSTQNKQQNVTTDREAAKLPIKQISSDASFQKEAVSPREIVQKCDNPEVSLGQVIEKDSFMRQNGDIQTQSQYINKSISVVSVQTDQDDKYIYNQDKQTNLVNQENQHDTSCNNCDLILQDKLDIYSLQLEQFFMPAELHHCRCDNYKNCICGCDGRQFILNDILDENSLQEINSSAPNFFKAIQPHQCGQYRLTQQVPIENQIESLITLFPDLNLQNNQNSDDSSWEGLIKQSGYMQGHTPKNQITEHNYRDKVQQVNQYPKQMSLIKDQNIQIIDKEVYISQCRNMNDLEWKQTVRLNGYQIQ
ncbi:hypothetical protein SS50377_23602 [Spironucleus salmonicida]|uniref:Uncharacterized protein n=1 Tax=Spironucleus salmonicida TaxID=348837 RepID=V6M5E6_9EUKA|nr:hypothetical protein SS50377_23602 [Spironucleus salmonicida]|eukprot:EST48584.1 Hypothetical protein SS50377_11195 [Spironucleus salmonicida]